MSTSQEPRTSLRRNFLNFVGLSAVAGVLATAAVTPALAITGMTANSGLGIFDNLPEYLDIGSLSQKTNIYATDKDKNPVLLASFYDQNRMEVSWDRISQYAKDAAIAGEDPRFYEHGGIDLFGTVRAMVATASGGDTQGGSSITQQYVKNVLVQKAEAKQDAQERKKAYQDAVETTPQRKLREMKMAIGVEKEHTKDSILLGYLNIALFGGRVYGIEAASNYYFNTTAADLTLPQAASLLAIVNNPERLRIDEPENEVNGAADGYSENRSRRDYILGKMRDEGKITQQDYEAAAATAVEPRITPASSGCETAGGSAYFCDYVTKIFQNNEIFGPDDDTRWANFKRGGFDVYTSLDLDLQRAAEDAIKKNVPSVIKGKDLGAVAVSVQPGTGRVLAMAQSKEYSQDPEVLETGDNWSSVNYNTDFEYGGSTGFQPGSTYKTFTLAEWLGQGHSLNETFDGTRKAHWGVFQDSCEGPHSEAWNPANDEGGNGGTYNALQATVGSINTAFVGMAKKLDMCGIRKMAQSFGVHRADGEPLAQSPATVLGTNEIAPLTMANAFAGIAARGVVCNPVAIDRIVGRDGKELPVPAAGCEQKVEPDVTAGMTYAMERVISSGTGASSSMRTGIPHFGKTGTTDNNEATWMSGGSTKVVTVTGVFNITGHVDLRNTSFPSSGQAAQIRHKIWPAIMAVADAKYGGDAFAQPTGKSIRSATVPIPHVVGMSLSEARKTLEGAGFTVVDGGAQDSELPEGAVVTVTPEGTAARGSAVTVTTSNGELTVVPDVVAGSATYAEALSRLKAAGFSEVTCQAINPNGNNRKPVAQNPAAGTTARRNAAITISADRCDTAPAPSKRP